MIGCPPYRVDRQVTISDRFFREASPPLSCHTHTHHHCLSFFPPTAYSSKATRNGIRVCDLKDMAAFGDKLRKLSLDGSKRFGADYHYDVDGEIAHYTAIAPTVAPLVSDTVDYINNAYDAGKRILIEGANATMLDLDFGTYPYVTSSNPSIGGIATGLGLAPNKYQALIGVVSGGEEGWGESWKASALCLQLNHDG